MYYDIKIKFSKKNYFINLYIRVNESCLKQKFKVIFKS